MLTNGEAKTIVLLREHPRSVLTAAQQFFQLLAFGIVQFDYVFFLRH